MDRLIVDQLGCMAIARTDNEDKVRFYEILPIFLISQGTAVSQKEDKHIDVLYSISNVEWGGYNKDAELLTVIDCQGRLEGRSDQTSQVKCD